MPDPHPSEEPSLHTDLHMGRALELARDMLGQTWPNPTVGAVIVKDGKIVGEGATAKGGRPHAETIAIEQAGEHAKGAILYVTLEPCTHYGRTPPCADAIIMAGITECVIACRDPNPKVRGGGVQYLRDAGLTVIEGPGCDEAADMHRGFFSVIEKNRPFIAMKIAISADGKIAREPGKKTWVTGQDARMHGMALRAEYDAILTGIGTVLADDPLLNVRIEGLEHRSPVRVLLDSRGRLPADSQLRKTEHIHPLWIYSRNDDVIQSLTGHGITRLLIEAGKEVNSYFMKKGLVDRIYLYRSRTEIGEGGLDAIDGNILKKLKHWEMVDGPIPIAGDVLEIYEKRES